ncbi:MAG: lipid A export permease/ATP-binding protein MsbA [SAR86 cluster bacterium]|uniref:Lipid A export permease/ATP-binding protein MsbA n=1 Tax=SAR86 cluster bacterium TaxID=2030880 RepID=A0A2A4X126_9GAMM|nr:MAG: lipid A export permease/ATP-binding protein MsbA [SAR86 cluster bacterium]
MSETDRKIGKEESWRLYRRLFSYVIPHRMLFATAMLGYIIFALTAPAATWWLGWTVDAIAAEDYEALRILSPLAFIGLAAVRGLGGFMGSYYLAGISNYLVHELRCELIDRLIRLPASYFDNNSSGRLVSKLTYDVMQITGAASNAVAVVVREGFTVVGLLAYLMYMDWKLSLTFLIIAPVVGKVVSIASKKFRRYSTQIQDSMGDVTQITTETIKGHRVIRTFNAEDYVSKRLSAASEKNRVQNMKMVLTRSASTPLIQLIVSTAIATLVWFAMSAEFFATNTPGDFVAFLSAAGLLAKPIRQLTQINAVIQRGLSAAASIFELLDEELEKDAGTQVLARAEGRVEFANVSFSYNEGVQTLADISFVAQPGQTIALVGKSGSGKSSLVSLITRFYDFQQGEITLDGVPLKSLKLESLRENISLVSQQVVLFNGTVEENIAYGEDVIDHEKTIKAANDAHAMEFIEQLEQGIDTPVGDDAVLLSGGQRQRIAIARALLKDAPILIFDEATSALDSESEMHIQEALDTLRQGRTTFVIAHRLSTIEKADLILVMEKGKIIESGTHEELLAKQATYSRLHAKQFSENAAAPAE